MQKFPPTPVSLWTDIRRTLWLAAPMILAQLMQTSAGFVDTVIAGKIGPVILAATGVATALWFVVFLGCVGLMNCLSPIISRRLGAGQIDDVGHIFRQGLWLGAIVCLIGVATILWLSTKLGDFGIDPDLIGPGEAYLKVVAWSLLPVGMTLAVRGLFEATENTPPILIITAIGLGINILLSYALALGKFGLPAMGIVGIAWATNISFLVSAIVSFIFCFRPYLQVFELFKTFEWPSIKMLKIMLVLAIPIALSLLFEASLFTVVTVQMGVLGEIPAAANIIALQAASYCFMLPLGLSFVLVARMGNALGREDIDGIRQRLKTGLVIAAGMTIITMTVLIGLRPQIIGLFTEAPEVIALANTLLLFAALFQLSDTTQVTFNASLRGLQDTKIPMLINGFSYWVMGFGVGYLLAHNFGYGAPGLWIGLVFGLSFGSVLLAIRLRHVIRSLSFNPAG